MLREAQLEAFVAGNLRENEAAEMVRGVRAALPAAPLAAERLPVRRLRRLPPGGATRQFLAGNPEEPNGALEMYLQVGEMGRDGERWGEMGRRTCRWRAAGRTRPSFAVPYAHSGRGRVRVRVRVAALLAECLICVSVSLQCGRLSVSLASTPTAPCPVAGQTSRHLPGCRLAPTRATIGCTCCSSRR